MKVLALDTSSKAASCALWDDGALKGEFYLNVGLTHSQTIMPMVQSLLQSTGAQLAEIDRFGVSTGPGSFTGLRIGLSAVKGMAMATGKPCVGVSTLEGLCRNIACFQGYLVPVMDARCMQVYTALFRSENGVVTRLEEDMAIPLTQLEDKLRALPPAPMMLVGDGAALCLAQLAERLPGLQISPEGLRLQRAGSVALLAAESTRTVPAAELEPAYLRLPQAQRELMKKKEEAKQ